MIEGESAALLIVDVQNDFCAGGALAVPDAERVVDAMNRYIDEAVARGAAVYASCDWHPPASRHFRTSGGRWPPHCVQGTDGARFHPDLRLPSTAIIVTKGADPDADGYSAFEGRTAEGRTFGADLGARGIRRLYVGGLATDYCVRRSVLDALAAGHQVTVLADAVAGVNQDDSVRALEEMRREGADIAGAS